MKVLIIIPTYNEKENIRQIIEAIFHVAKSYHILVVDDNSPDKTGAIVKKLQRRFKNLRLVERDFKEGIGPAYLVGFHYALKHRYDYIIQMDADLSHDPEMLPAMVALARVPSWVIGSRYVKGGSIKGWERKRILVSLLGNWYTRFFLGFNIKDWTAGFNVWSKEILAKLNLGDDEFPNGYAFQIAIKYKALKLGFSPVEVPITFRDRERGKTKIGGGILNEAAITVIRLKISKDRRPKR